jgi:hypothetical protein
MDRSPARPFFASLFDTTRRKASEIAAAKTIAMLQSLSDSPPQFATIQAINSKLLLDDCATSDEFLHLVREGRIHFRPLPDKTGPRQELLGRLRTERYLYLGAWPELYEGEGHGLKQIPDRIRKAEEFLASHGNGDARTDDPTLNARLDNANRLFCAIEQAPTCPAEIGRSTFFEQTVLAIPKELETQAGQERPAQASSKTLLSAFLRAILNEGSNKSRAAIYARIDGHPMLHVTEREATELRAAAKARVDFANDLAVAHSLESRLLSIGLDPADSTVQRPSEWTAAEATVVPLTASQQSRLGNFAADWRHVVAALSPSTVKDGDVEDAYARLAALMAGFEMDASPTWRRAEVVARSAAVVAAVVSGVQQLSGRATVANGPSIHDAAERVAVHSNEWHWVTLSSVGVAISAAAVGLLATKNVKERVSSLVTTIRQSHTAAEIEEMRGLLQLK